MSTLADSSSDQRGGVILFCCNRVAPTLELAYVMRALAKGGITPVAILESHNLRERLPESVLADLPVEVLADLLIRNGPVTLARIVGLVGRAFRLLRFNIVADALATLRGLLAGRVALDRLSKRHDVRAIVVADDRSLGWEYGMVLAAKAKGIGSAAIPFALSDPDADWIPRSGRSTYDLNDGGFFERWMKGWLYQRYPENIRTKDGRMLMFLTVGQASTLLAVDAPMKTPWAYGGGITDIVAVFGESDREKQIALGVPGRKLVVSGHCSMDQLFAARNSSLEIRKGILPALGISLDSKVIVCAVPQYLEHGMLDASKHWALTEQMVGDLTSSGAKVLLSLHPRSRMEDYVFLSKKFGATILSKPLVDVIAVADLFVATHSSTVRWAVLMRIPTIVLDDFDIGGGAMYLRGVRYLKERDQLRVLSRELLLSKSIRQSICAELDEQAKSLDPFDGKNAARCIALLSKLITNKSNASPRGQSSERKLHEVN